MISSQYLARMEIMTGISLRRVDSDERDADEY